MTGRRDHDRPHAAAALRAERRVAIAVTAGLCLATAAVFLPLRHAEFIHYDDGRLLPANPYTRAGLTWAGVAWAATDTSFHWIPLTWLSFMLDCQLFGIDAGKHHVVNLLLHVANTGLLLQFLRRTSARLWPSVLAAALFALHPLHVEAVAWLSGRTHLLSTLCWFATLLGYARYVERPTHGRYALVCLGTIAGILSKNMTVTLPLTLLLLDYWPLCRIRADAAASQWSPTLRTLVLEKLPLAGIAAAGIAVELALTRRGFGDPGASLPLARRLAEALLNYGNVLVKTVWPVALIIPYPPHPATLSPWPVGGSLFGLVLAGVVVAAFGRRHRYLLTGWLWYLVTLAPVVGLVRIRNQSLADRYTYVPLVGLFIVGAWGASDLARRHPIARVAVSLAGAAAVLACVVLTRVQIGYWRDSVTLFRHTVAVTPDNRIARINLGAALKGTGRRAEAFAQFAEVLRLDPDNLEAHANLSSMFIEDRQPAAAEEHARAALRHQPDAWLARLNLGTARLMQGDTAGARNELSLAVQLRPGEAAVHFALGQTFEAEGLTTEALAAYRQAIRLDANFVGAHAGLARALARVGDRAGAIAAYRRVLELDAAFSQAHLELARLLEATGDVAGSAAEYRETLRRNPAAAEATDALRRLEGPGR